MEIDFTAFKPSNETIIRRLILAKGEGTGFIKLLQKKIKLWI